VKANPTPAERRFASSFFADSSACGVRAIRTEMRADGRMDSWIWIAAVDTQTMLRLGILISDQLAGGVTDVVLDLADVVVVEKHGLGVLARIGTQLREIRRNRRDPSSHGTLTVERAPAEVAQHLEPLVAGGLVTIREPTFPDVLHSPEAYHA
jgi:hypothetical protein